MRSTRLAANEHKIFAVQRPTNLIKIINFVRLAIPTSKFILSVKTDTPSCPKENNNQSSAQGKLPVDEHHRRAKQSEILQRPCLEAKHCLVPAGHALGMRSKDMTSISSVPGQLWDTDVIM